MSALTGGFDAVIQLSGNSLASVARAMHQAGSITHQHVRISNGVRYEFSFGAPRVELDATTHSDPWARVIARTRAICRAHAVDDPYSPVDSAVAELTLRGRFELPAGDPAPIGPLAQLDIDWSETQASDVVVVASTPAASPGIQSALLEMAVSDSSASFDLGHLDSAGVSEMAMTAVPAAGIPALGIGLNFTGNGGARGAIPNLLQQEWVAVIDAELVAERIVVALQQSLGALPPPYGPGPVLVDEQSACVLETPFGCIQAMQRVYLDSLTVELTVSGIKFAGSVRQVSDPVTIFPIPPVSAQWQATVSPAVAPGGGLTMTVGQPAVQLNEWYAVVANMFSSNALEAAVRAGVQEAVGAGFAGGDPSGMLGALVGQLAAAGRTADAKLVPRPTVVQCGPQALQLHGVIDHMLGAPLPVAAFSVLASPNAGELLFDALGSWAPSDDAITLEWDFGDGSVVTGTGVNASIATDHTYANGDYVACLTVTDAQGRSEGKCMSVRPGRLVLNHLTDEHTSKSAWEACALGRQSVEVSFQVTSCGSFMPGVTVSAVGTSAPVQAVTDGRGRATLKLDVADASPPTPNSHSSFADGSFVVEAELTGFDSDDSVLELIDCDELWRTLLATKKDFARRMDRLAGYAALRDLIKSGAVRKTVLPQVLPTEDPRVPPPGPGPKQPVRSGLTGDESDAITVGLGAQLLEDLLRLIELNNPAFPVHELLGLSPRDGDFGKQLNLRLGTMWTQLDRTARRLDRSAPGGRDPSRPPIP